MLIQGLYAKLRDRLGLPKRPNPWRTRPFEPRDLHAVPEGYRIGTPDFVGIGAGRSGTTWWYRLLLEHPSIKPNRLAEKELSFFFHFGCHGIDADAISTYRQAFAAPYNCLCGEWTPGYLCYPFALDYLAASVPDAKLMAIVRNPIDRMLSALNHRARLPYGALRLKGTRSYLYRTFSVLQVVVAHSMYADAFRRVLNRFDRAKLLVLQYEQCVREPVAQIAKTYRFLGVDDSFAPSSLGRRFNAAPCGERPAPAERAMLADWFRDDVQAFASMFPEVDLSLWSDFA